MESPHVAVAVLLLAALPAVASATHLYRCIGPSGQVSYQSSACAARHRTDRIIEFTPDARTAPREAQADAHRRVARGASTPSLRGSSRGQTRPAAASACQVAKTRRERELEKLGLKRTFDDLSRLDAGVRSVCNGY